MNPQKKSILVIYRTALALLLGLMSCSAWNNFNPLEIGGKKATPCLEYGFEDVNPLIVGKTTQAKTGKSSDSDCIFPAFAHFNKSLMWLSKNAGIVKVSPDGTVTGIAPGKFSVFAKKGGETLSMSGIVYPPDWTLRILPEVATVRVGDRITFKMFVSDSKGRLLPPVTYFQFSAFYYQQPIPGARSKSPNPEPLVDQTQSAGTFQALRPGTITITGKMGDRIKSATLTIK